MTAEIIVEFPSPLTEKEQRMIYGYKGELIRCKDCKHWDGYYCHNKWWGDGYGNYTPPIKSEDGFCDWAEGKENDKID